MQTDLPTQDCVLFEENGHVALAAVADGVSSCKNAAEGAQIACQTIKQIMTQESDYYFSCKQDCVGSLLLNYVCRVLQSAADEAGEDVMSYASTLSFVCFHKKSGKMMVFSLGDSKVFSVGETGIQCLTDSQADENNRCCATVTQGAEKQVQLQVFVYDGQTDYLLMTDGAWRLLYTDCRLRKDLREQIEKRNYRDLASFFENMKPTDDCSYIALQSDRKRSEADRSGGLQNE